MEGKAKTRRSDSFIVAEITESIEVSGFMLAQRRKEAGTRFQP